MLISRVAIFSCAAMVWARVWVLSYISAGNLRLCWHDLQTPRETSMFHAFPDEYVRAQLAVGALVLFGVSRVIGAAVGVQRGWRISTLTRCFIGAADVRTLTALCVS